jgi:hypothetical protein
MFSVYGGKCLSRKAIHSWLDKFFQGRLKVEDDARAGAEVGETTVKRLLCCGFRRTGKAMLVKDISRNNFFSPDSNIACFAFFIHL